MMRNVIAIVLIFLFSCRGGEKFNDVKNDLKNCVSGIQGNWIDENISYEIDNIPYIIINENKLKDTTFYYLDKRQILGVDSVLNSTFKNILFKKDILEIKYFNNNFIEFIVDKDRNIFREKSTIFLYSTNERLTEGCKKLPLKNWYLKTKKMSW